MTQTHLFVVLYILTIARLLAYIYPKFFRTPLQRRNFNETIDSLVQAGMSALLLIHFVVRSYYIPSGSMKNTLLENDYILVNELQYRFTPPARGDVAVFHPPPSYQGDKEDLIKRVVGIEGDIIEVREDGKLYRNNELVNEPFIREQKIEGTYGPYRVRPGHVFMMGDNRNDSFDSRFWGDAGDVPLANFVGKAELIFLPPQRIGRIR